jgi:3-phosphoshikimate 1-carboxyvinyltransferase
VNLLENKTVLIIGLGLIGGSIARSLASGKHCKRILAHGQDSIALQSALNDGNIDAYSTDLCVLTPQADIIVICTPTLSVRGVLEQLRYLVTSDTIITDVASVKGNIAADARRLFAESLHRIVPGHPIAGSEKSGYSASRADLFRNRKVILTPLIENSSSAVQTVMSLWQKLGADVHAMSAERHDVVLAGTSHLPHLLAYTLVNTLVDSVSQPDRAQQVFDYAAGGFADFSRIASSDPAMWRDIFIANKNATINVLDAYVAELKKVRHKLMISDGEGMKNDFSRAKFMRDEFIKRFRPDTINHQNNNKSDSNFTLIPDVISVFPGSFLSGSFRPAAKTSIAIDAILFHSQQQGVFELSGVPEDFELLTLLKALREANILILGPESGYARVYGLDSQNPDSLEGQRLPATLSSLGLPADHFVCGLFVLGAVSLKNSQINLGGLAKRPAEVAADHFDLFETFAQFGFSAKWLIEPSGELTGLEINSFTPRSASIDLKNQDIDNNELLLVFAAATLAPSVSMISLESDRIELLLNRLGRVATWGADVSVDGELICIVPKDLNEEFVDCNNDPHVALTAIAIGQRAKKPLRIRQTGDLAGVFPGLLMELSRLGFGFSTQKTEIEDSL